MSHQSLDLTFVPPNTIRVTLTLTDFDGTAITDCATHAVTVTKPDGTTHSSYTQTDVTNKGDGTYTLDIPIASDDDLGVYELLWTITYSSQESSAPAKFKVE